MAEVKLVDVTKRFGDFKAVDGANIHIRDREFAVLVGPSGCGKSTLLRMIAGLEDISDGQLYIGDQLVNDVQPKDRDVAMVFQSYALYPHMNIYDNMSFALRMKKKGGFFGPSVFTKEEIDARVREAADILGIMDQLDKRPRELSGGQRQRVAIGRAIVRNPKVFLFDEPLSNLDAKLRVQMRTELAKLHKRLKATMVYVTHDQAEAMTLGDKVVVLEKGKVRQIAPPQQMYDSPDNKFVAGFIGSPSMNFFDCAIIDDDGKLMADLGDFELPLPTGLDFPANQVGKEAVLGIRPEDIYSADFVTGVEDTGELSATLEVAEHMGSEVYLHLVNGELEFLARVDPKVGVNVGREMKLVFDMSKAHVFEKNSGKALI